jgi:hypothetical protein
MRCQIHPTEEAIAVCKSCGKGLCQNCNIDVNKISYCKNCIETGKVTFEPKEESAPEIISTTWAFRTGFKRGSLGLLSAGIALLVLATVSYVDLFAPMSDAGAGIIVVILFVVLGLGLGLSSSGYNTIHTVYGYTIGIVGEIVGAVSGVFFFIYLLLSFEGMNYSGTLSAGGLFYLIAFCFLGITQLVWGTINVVIGKSTQRPRLSLISGILLMCSGGLLTLGPFEPVMGGLGIPASAISLIVASALFLAAKEPPETKHLLK